MTTGQNRRADNLVSRLRQYEGKNWQTTVCYNGLRDEAAATIEAQAAEIERLKHDVERHIGIASAECGRADQRPAGAEWACSARRQSLPEPADCDWPVCGCDPAASKVIEALQESGTLTGDDPTARAALETAFDALLALKTAVKDAGTMNGREYVDLGIQVNNALDKAKGALAASPTPPAKTEGPALKDAAQAVVDAHDVLISTGGRGFHRHMEEPLWALRKALLHDPTPPAADAGWQPIETAPRSRQNGENDDHRRID